MKFKINMKSQARFSLITVLLLFTTCMVFAQRKKAPYNAIIYTQNKGKIQGKLTAINDTALVIADKRDLVNYIPFDQVTKIKIYKYRSDIGYSIITGALVIGNIAAAQSLSDGNAALIMGTAGTVGIVALSMLLHNAIHGPILKIKASEEKIDYNNVSKKISPYVVNDAALKP